MARQNTLKTLLERISDDDLEVLLNELQERKKNKADQEEAFDDPIQTAGTIDTKKERPNQFLSMKFNTREQRELKKDAKIDEILLKNHEPVAKERETAQFVSVTCSVCGKQEQVSSTLIHNSKRYRCNNCYQG